MTRIVASSSISEATTKCSRNCYTCNHINEEPYIVNDIIGTRYVHENSGGDCTSKNLCYVIKCRHLDCREGFIYVGETARRLGDRFTEHRRNVINGGSRNKMIAHFNTNGHTVDDMTIKIIERIVEQDKYAGYLARVEAERWWQIQLMCSYPLGFCTNLNKVGNIQCTSDIQHLKKCIYFQNPPPSLTRIRGANCKRKRRTTQNDTNNAIDRLTTAENMCDFIKVARQVSKKALFSARDVFVNWDTRRKDIIIALISKKCQPKNSNSTKPSIDMRRICIPYTQGIETIRLKKVINTDRLNRFFGTAHTFRPSVTYTYAPPLILKVGNHTKILKRLDTVQLLEILRSPCNCNTDYGASNGHCLTGDMSIVEDNELRSILNKGSNFRLKEVFNFNKFENSVKDSIRTYCGHFTTDIAKIEQFMTDVTLRYTEMLHIQSSTRGIKWTPRLQLELNKLQSKYVLVIADKIPGSIVIKCKYSYIKDLCDEMGVVIHNGGTNFNGNNIYKHVNITQEDIITRHNFVFNECFKKTSTETHIPLVTHLPKIHKPTAANRTLVAAKRCFNKDMSIIVRDILKGYEYHFKNLLEKTHSRNHVRTYCGIGDSGELSRHLQHGGRTDKIYSGDFTALFTSLKHTTIVNAIEGIIAMCHKNVQFDRFKLCRHRLVYSEKGIHRNAVMVAINELLTNSYIRFAGENFIQTIGTAMGGSSSCHLATMTLAFYEYRYLNQHVDTHIKYLARYVDDVYCEFDGMGNELKIELTKMYPSELILNDTHRGYKSCDFLDMTIDKASNDYNSYNKIQLFRFEVRRLFHSVSCVPDSMMPATVLGELHRGVKINANSKHFVKYCKGLYRDLIKNEYKPQHITRFFKAGLYKIHDKVALKYNCDVGFILNSVIKNE